MINIRKAVFPVAGLGSRFLPVTKASPKEMLPVVDKPLIQYAVEEAVEAGCTDIVFVTGRNKRAIEDHFDANFELEHDLESKGKQRLLDVAREVVPPHVNCAYVRQPKALGLGHAVLCARPVVGNEPFAVILPDDMVDNEGPGCLKQMINAISDTESVIAVEEVPTDEVSSYGVVCVENTLDNPAKLLDLVEKPPADQAPSNLAVIGRYILQPRIFEILEHTQKGAGGEIQLTDAIRELAQEQTVAAYQFEGVRYDCGSKLGFLKATVQYALKHEELGKDFRAYLDSV